MTTEQHPTTCALLNPAMPMPRQSKSHLFLCPPPAASMAHRHRPHGSPDQAISVWLPKTALPASYLLPAMMAHSTEDQISDLSAGRCSPRPAAKISTPRKSTPRGRITLLTFQDA